MSETKNIYQRILAVMSDVAYVQKENKKVNNQYSFVSHDQVSAVLHPVLVKHGIVVIPSVTKWQQDGNRTVADVTVSFVNADNPEDKIDVGAFGYGIDTQDKGPGKAISYATKYAMLKTFVLETGDDPERDSIDHETEDVTAMTARAKAAIQNGDWLELCLLDKEGGDTWLAVWDKLGTKAKGDMRKLQDTKLEYKNRFEILAGEDDEIGFSELLSEMSVDAARYVCSLWAKNEPAREIMIKLMSEEKKAA